MNETKKTMTFVLVAAGLALLALFTVPRGKQPDVFSDVGQEFFPVFTDPNEAVSLEVIRFDETAGQALPFKVEFREGGWRIPSHEDYPAVGADRLARTAAGLIGIRKDDFRTDNVAEHESCGVIDPLDDKTLSLKGRGQRITLKGENDRLLADLIIGKPVTGAAGFRLVRVPGQKRVYAAKITLELSTKFTDWIEPDLLKLSKDDIDRVIVKNYAIDEASRQVRHRDELTLSRDGQGPWRAAERKAGEQEVNQPRLEQLLESLAGLRIVDVRRKPEGLAQGLRQGGGGIAISQAEARSLQTSGFYFGGSGQLLAKEGELVCETRNGVRYELRFGEMAYGEEQDEAEGGEKEKGGEAGSRGENRYILITAEFVAARLAEPETPADLSHKDKPREQWNDVDRRMQQLAEAHEAWQQKMEGGSKAASELNARFADWYYVISADSFASLHLGRAELMSKTEEKKP